MKIKYQAHTIASNPLGTDNYAVASNKINQTINPGDNRAAHEHRGAFKLFIGVVLLVWLCLLCATSARAFSLYDSNMNPDGSPVGSLTDIIANTNEFWSWVPIGSLTNSTNTITITYKFDQKFIDFFGSAQSQQLWNSQFGTGLQQIEDQVRRALTQWSQSSYSNPQYGVDPSGNLYGQFSDPADTYGIGSYARRNTMTTQFGSLLPGAAISDLTYMDIRSTTLHELGHVLGLAHPDINSTLNFRIYPHNSDFPLAFFYGPGGPGNTSGEILAGGQTPTTGEVMYADEAQGWINHILSWDDLDGYNIAYSQVFLNFVEVGSSNAAQIVFTTYSDYPTNVATGIPYGTLQDGNPLDGVLITNGIVEYNTNCMYPIGFMWHGMNWDITTSVPVSNVVFQIYTGSDNLTAGYWNQNLTSAYDMTITPAQNYNKDNIQVNFTGPISGFAPNTEIPAGKLFHAGVGIDVGDWTVENAWTTDVNPANQTTLPATSVQVLDFTGGTVVSPTVSRIGMSPAKSTETRLTVIPNAYTYGAYAGTNSAGTNSVGHGFSIVCPASAGVTISGLKVADVTGMGLTFSNLTTNLLNKLGSNGSLTTISNFGSRTLAAGQKFTVLLQGSTANLPTNILAGSNYFIYNQPSLAGKEVFAYWQSSNTKTVVGNYALLGEPPVVAAPVPALSIHSANTNSTVVVCWPAPSTGYTLQYSSSLTNGLTNNPWYGLTNWPTMVCNVNQETISRGMSNKFFRLKKYTVSQ